MGSPSLLRLAAVFFAGLFTLQAARPFLCCDHNGGKVCAVSAEGKIEWESACKAPQDCWRLPDGNTVSANHLGHGHVGEQPQFVEVARDKKVVWQFRDDARFKTINQVQMLDIPGDVPQGEILR